VAQGSQGSDDDEDDRPASAKETKFTRQIAYASSKTQTKNVAFFSLRIDLHALAFPNCFTN
jgi:hypothetical protein